MHVKIHSNWENCRILAERKWGEEWNICLIICRKEPIEIEKIEKLSAVFPAADEWNWAAANRNGKKRSLYHYSPYHEKMKRIFTYLPRRADLVITVGSNAIIAWLLSDCSVIALRKTKLPLTEWACLARNYRIFKRPKLSTNFIHFSVCQANFQDEWFDFEGFHLDLNGDGKLSWKDFEAALQVH